METERQEFSMELNSEEQVLAQARSLADRGQWKEAISLLKRLEQVRPLSVKALSKLAYYYSQDGAYDDAINLYKNLSQRQPSEGKWFYYIGFQYQQQEKWPEAITSYQKCLNLAPRWLLPALRLGDTYYGMEESERALEAYRKGIKSYMELPPKWYNDINNKSTYGKLCSRAARLLLDKQNRSEKEIAQAYLKKGDHGKALKAYERIPEHKRGPLHSLWYGTMPYG